MKFRTNLFLILFSLLAVTAFSQSNFYKIQGTWISVNNLSKATNEKVDDNYVKFTFKGSKLLINSFPTILNTDKPVSYELYDNAIYTGDLEDSGYFIEKTSKDTLVIADAFENSRARRFIFVNEQTLVNENFKKLNGNNIFIANKYCTPSQKQNIQKLVYEFFKGKVNDNLDIAGTFKINIQDKVVETTLTSENVDEKKLKRLKGVLDKTFDYWDLSLFEKFKIIEIPFVIHGRKIKEFENVRLDFFK